MSNVELRKFIGVRNDVSPERFNSGDLAEAINIDLDETGAPAMRAGITEINAVDSHSLWADGDLAFIVRGGTMHRILPDMTIVDLGLPIVAPVSYVRVVNDVFYSDGVTTGVLNQDGGYRPWGIVPPTTPEIEQVDGEMQAGRYMVTMTYVRANGQESGACAVQVEVVGVSQGLSFPNLPVSSDPLVETKRIYVSDCDGELPYLVAVVENSETLLTLRALPPERTIPVRTLRCGPPPAGRCVGVYNGRTYVAENNYLWYSEPYEYELVNRGKNYLGFAKPITFFAPVSDGLFVGSDSEIVFLGGSEPEQFELKVVANYGAIRGTASLVPEGFRVGEDGMSGEAWMLMSTKGVCLAADGGEFRNLTGGRYTPPEGVSSGASLFKVRGGTPQLVTTLFS